MIENINSYNETEFKKIFTNTEIYKKLEQNFSKKNLVWNKFVWLSPAYTEQRNLIWRSVPMIKGRTPRARMPTLFSASVFYYLLPLLEIEYDSIYDLGCGANLFKPYIPRLVGIGDEWVHIKNSYEKIKDASWPNITCPQDFDNLPSNIKSECSTVHNLATINDVEFYGDIYGSFDYAYVQQHALGFQAIFSICALHFCPLSQFRKIVLDFVSLVKSGGRGFLALNLQRMIERESTHFLMQEFSTITPTRLQYEQYLRKELSTCNLKFLIVDIDLTLIDEGLDGNIRLVFEK